MTIKEARLKMNLTQQQCADFLGMPKHTLCNWEQGYRTPPDYIERLIVEKILSYTTG